MTALFLLLLFSSFNHPATHQPEPNGLKHFRITTIEKVKGCDCTIIPYGLSEPNKTLTVRDDQQLGVFHFVSGKDCQEIFGKTFSSFRFKGEDLLPLPAKTIDAGHASISVLTGFYKIGDPYVHLHSTSFWLDNETDDVRDDVYLGTDFIINAPNADDVGQLNFSPISGEFKNMQATISFLENTTYYKLREMIVNRNLVVDALRKEKRLKTINLEGIPVR